MSESPCDRVTTYFGEFGTNGNSPLFCFGTHAAAPVLHAVHVNTAWHTSVASWLIHTKTRKGYLVCKSRPMLSLEIEPFRRRPQCKTHPPPSAAAFTSSCLESLSGAARFNRRRWNLGELFRKPRELSFGYRTGRGA